MTTRSKRQLESPTLARDAYIVVAASPLSGTPAVRDTIANAAAAIGEAPGRILGFVHTCYYGPHCAAADTHAQLELDAQGYSVSATDSAALWEGAKTVASGYSACVLVMGGEAGNACVVLADRETAETLAPNPIRLSMAVAGPAADADEVLGMLTGMSGSEGGAPETVEGDVLAHVASRAAGLGRGESKVALVRAEVLTALGLRG